MRSRVAAPLAALALVVPTSVGWVVSDHLEQRNDFCNACHLPSGVALHTEHREFFDRVIPANLAGVHGRGLLEDREDQAFRCIDCHSGSGPVERARVKLLAARDGVRYAMGAFREPDGMPFDLSRQTCLDCHPSFRRAAAPGWTLEAFHGRAEHDGQEAPACVRCHGVHEPGGDPFAYFMDRARVDAQCRVCHTAEGAGEIPSLVVERADQKAATRSRWPVAGQGA